MSFVQASQRKNALFIIVEAILFILRIAIITILHILIYNSS